MLRVRRSCFETNSSSTHAICIPSNQMRPSYVSFQVGRFGWEEDEVDAQEYLYTAICECCDTPEEYQITMTNIIGVLEKYNIPYNITEPKWRDSTWREGYRYINSDEGYIDHCEELSELIHKCLEDEIFLLNYLAGATVFTGNDNTSSTYVDDMANLFALEGYEIFWKTN